MCTKHQNKQSFITVFYSFQGVNCNLHYENGTKIPSIFHFIACQLNIPNARDAIHGIGIEGADKFEENFQIHSKHLYNSYTIKKFDLSQLVFLLTALSYTSRRRDGFYEKNKITLSEGKPVVLIQWKQTQINIFIKHKSIPIIHTSAWAIIEIYKETNKTTVRSINFIN